MSRRAADIRRASCTSLRPGRIRGSVDDGAWRDGPG